MEFTAAEVIAIVAKQIGCTQKEVRQALVYNCVIDEIRQQVEWLAEQRKEADK